MPTTTDTEYLDGEFTVTEEIPSSVAELTALIGEQAVLDEATGNLYYRNKYPRVYKKVSKEVAEKGFARAVTSTKTLKDGTERNILVSEMDHLRAYLATGEEAKTTLLSLFTTIGQSEPLYVKGERAGGGNGKIAKKFLDISNAIVAKGDDAVENAVTKIEAKVSGYKVGRDSDGAPTPESLARGVALLTKQIEKEALQNALA